MTHIFRYAVPIITALITYLYLYIKVDSDADYLNVIRPETNRMFLFTKKEYYIIRGLLIATIILSILNPTFLGALCTAYLLVYIAIESQCDKLTKLVSTTPYYIGVLTLFIVNIVGNQINLVIGLLFPTLFAYIFTNILHLSGTGDEGFIAIPGIVYLYSFSNGGITGGIDAIFISCIVVLMAAITSWVYAYKNNFLEKNYLKTKKPIPFGPFLTYSTFIVYIMQLTIYYM